MSSHDRPSPLEPFVDLVAVLIAVALGTAVSLGAVGSIPAAVRVAVGFLFVFVLPGYALLAALYPAMYVSSLSRHGVVRSRGGRMSAVEKVTLTLGLSIFTVPISVLCLDFFRIPIEPTTTVGTVAAVTVTATLVAAVRRQRAPASQDTGIRPGRIVAMALDHVKTQLAIGPSTAAVAVVILLAGAGVAGAALVDAKNGERYTELSLMTVEPESGNVTADGYPQSFTVGEPESLIVSVDNHEGTRTRYTVVITAQQYSDTGETPELRQTLTLDSLTMNVPTGENRRERVPVTIDSVSGDGHTRLSFFLYKDSPPATPKSANAYREAYLWTNVTK